jgi:hypothetical protein
MDVFPCQPPHEKKLDFACSKFYENVFGCFGLITAEVRLGATCANFSPKILSNFNIELTSRNTMNPHRERVSSKMERLNFRQNETRIIILSGRHSRERIYSLASKTSAAFFSFVSKHII